MNEQQPFRDKLKDFVPDEEAEEVADILGGMFYSDNLTVLRESLVSWNKPQPKLRMTYFEGSQAHFVVFAVQNKVSASRDELYQAVNGSDFDRLGRFTDGAYNNKELKADLQKTLSTEDVRKVTDFLDEINKWKIENLPDFIVMYLNYAVPEKMKISADQFKENEIDAS